MRSFVQRFVLPLLAKRGAARVCEIGASKGGSTEVLAMLPNVTVTVIDPCLDCDLNQKFAGNSRVTVNKGTSLEVLPQLRGTFDCILIDGDHNWYTVYHELKAIVEQGLLKRSGIVFFHDIEWPWGRRDMYYRPETIPPLYCHDHEEKGIALGKSKLLKRRGFCRGISKATSEGGARNGVLTAIEDFLRDYKDEFEFIRVYGDCGLGMMYRRANVPEDHAFFALRRKAIVYNTVIWPKRFAEAIYYRIGRPLRS